MLGFSAQANAVIRHIYSFLAGAGLLFALMGIDPETQAKIIAAVHQIGDSVLVIIAGISTLAPIASALYARWTAKPEQQVKAVNALPNAEVKPIDPALPLTAGAPGATVKSHWLVGLVAMSVAGLLLLGCGGTQQERQDDADQAFGKVKVGLFLATSAVSIYNLLPVCGDGAPTPPLCYSETVGDAINKGLSIASDAVNSAEKVFAAANSTPGDKLDAVKAVSAALAELVANLAKYGITKGGG